MPFIIGVFSLNLSSVPAPNVSISLNSDGTLYQGTKLIMTCTVVVVSVDGTDFDIVITWTTNPPEVMHGPYITITDTSSPGQEFISTVTISPVDTTDSATYTCTATGSNYVALSMESSDTMAIVVEGESK